MIEARPAGRRVGLALAIAALMAGGGAARADVALDEHGGPVKGVAVSHDGRRALTASFDYSLILWDLRAERALAHLFGHDAAVNAVAFLPGDQRALSASDDGTIGLWDLASGAMVDRFEGHHAKVAAVAASADGRLAASAGWDRTVRIWDLATGSEVQALRGRDNMNAVRFAPDGRSVVAGASDGALYLWRLPDGAPLGVLDRHDFGITMLDLSADGRVAATASIDETVQLWDLAAGEPTGALFGHDGPVLAVALSPDGELVASGGADGTVRLWRRGDGDRLRVYARHAGAVWSVAFSPDGRTLLSGGADGLVLTYDLDRPPDGNPGVNGASAALPVAAAGEPLDDGSRGAQLYRKCRACHTITADGGHRAGPSLRGLFGRVAGSHPGYPYSEALRESRLVWTKATVAKLFEVGPEVLVPGSKMPLQRMTDGADRAELVAYLERITAEDAVRQRRGVLRP